MDFVSMLSSSTDLLYYSYYLKQSLKAVEGSAPPITYKQQSASKVHA